MRELDVDAHIKNYWKKIDEAGAGVFEEKPGNWGAKRLPVRMAR